MKAREGEIDALALAAFREGGAAGVDALSDVVLNQDLEPLRSFLDERFVEISRIERGLSEAERKEISRYFAMRIQPGWLRAGFVRSSVDKPFGYPGDYRIVETLFENQPEGATPYGRLLSAYALGVGPCQAHRARQPWAVGHLSTEAAATAAQGGRLEVLSYACGPERVLRAFFAEGGEANVTLCDFDGKALRFAKKKIIAAAGGTRTPEVRAIESSAIDIIKDPRTAASLRSSREDGTYDVVMVLGLLDYLPDFAFERFMDAMAGLLAPGGVCLLSNLHTENPWRSAMEYGMEWTVIHREKDEFVNLANGTDRLEMVEITTDASGTNLFYAGRRPVED